MKSIPSISRQMATYQAHKFPDRHSRSRSAVTLLLRESESGDIDVLMIERAHREGDPWSGHMAFPGGRLDADDAHSFDAAKRETLEEIGLDVDVFGRYLGRLSDITTHIRSGLSAMLVTPFVFSLETLPELAPNYEVADILWVPLAFLADGGNRTSLAWEYDGNKVELPCYYFQRRCIWGLSLGMLDELLRVVELADFPVLARD